LMRALPSSPQFNFFMVMLYASSFLNSVDVF
jgi:hypothetical protein